MWLIWWWISVAYPVTANNVCLCVLCSPEYLLCKFVCPVCSQPTEWTEALQIHQESKPCAIIGISRMLPETAVATF